MRLVFLSLCVATSSAAQPLQLWSSVDGKAPSAEWKYVRVGQQVTLHAVLKPNVAAADFEWYRLEPTRPSVDNTTPKFHFEPIPYRATEITACRGRDQCVADVAPTVLRGVSQLPGVGSMAFQVTATLPDGQVLKTPGMESVERGGLGPKVHKVAVRRDDTYLGFLTELVNTPYIFGSSGPDGSNQTDLLIGSDCADLAVYGQRRMGKQLAYLSSYTLDQHAPELARVDSQDGRGVARGGDGAPLRYGNARGQLRPGDVLHFPHSRHVGVLYEDREPLGVLDGNDLMIHTCWAPPTVEPIAASSCSSVPFRILRFR